MPNLTPSLLTTIAQLDNKESIYRVMLNSKVAAFLKEGEHFSRKVPPNCFISTAAGVLSGSILVVGWDEVPPKQVSVLRGLQHGLIGTLNDLHPDPQFFVPLLEEPLYELGEEVWSEGDPNYTQIGNIQGILKMQSFDKVQMGLLRTHHLNVIEGPMPENMLGVGAGIYYWVTKVSVWVPEGNLSPRPD
jgi:hypothetical protein